MRSFRCSFNRTVVRASLKSDTLIVCTAPRHHVAYASIEVSIDNGATFSSTGLHFEFTGSMIVNLSPSNGPARGGSLVIVSGIDFSAPCKSCLQVETSWWCAFNDVASVPATFDSSSQIRCYTPFSVEPATVQVRLLNGRAQASGTLPFMFLPTPALVRVHPLIANTFGGTILTIYGRNFYLHHGETWMCMISGAVVPAQILVDHTIRCKAPPLVTGRHTVKVANNGQDFVDDGLVLEASISPLIREIRPISGEQTGGTVVRIWVGSVNKRATTLSYVKCKFGCTVVDATMHTDNVLWCAAPEHGFGQRAR